MEGIASKVGNTSLGVLKKNVEKHWAKMSGNLLLKSIRSLRLRLEKCIAANGGIFEK